MADLPEMNRSKLLLTSCLVEFSWWLRLCSCVSQAWTLYTSFPNSLFPKHLIFLSKQEGVFPSSCWEEIHTSSSAACLTADVCPCSIAIPWLQSWQGKLTRNQGKQVKCCIFRFPGFLYWKWLVTTSEEGKQDHTGWEISQAGGMLIIFLWSKVIPVVSCSVSHHGLQQSSNVFLGGVAFTFSISGNLKLSHSLGRCKIQCGCSMCWLCNWIKW